MSRRHGGSIGEFWQVWRTSDEHFLTKTRLAIKNQLIKARTLSDCCGNYGEPGC